MIQNKVSNQAKRKLSQIPTAKKITERIYSYTLLEVTDYEVEIHLLINLKHTVIVADTALPF